MFSVPFLSRGDKQELFDFLVLNAALSRKHKMILELEEVLLSWKPVNI